MFLYNIQNGFLNSVCKDWLSKHGMLSNTYTYLPSSFLFLIFGSMPQIWTYEQYLTFKIGAMPDGQLENHPRKEEGINILNKIKLIKTSKT